MTDKPRESSRFLPRQRLMRVIGRPGKDGRLSPGRKTLLFFAVLLLLGALLAWLDPRPTLRHVDLTMLSRQPDRQLPRHGRQAGCRSGTPARQDPQPGLGRIGGEPAAADRGAGSPAMSQFALVQDGTRLPGGSGLELLGRLPQPESLIILGRDLERVRVPLDLAGLRIGIGPVGSGTRAADAAPAGQLSELRLVRLDADDRPAARHAGARRARPRRHGDRRTRRTGARRRGRAQAADPRHARRARRWRAGCRSPGPAPSRPGRSTTCTGCRPRT